MSARESLNIERAKSSEDNRWRPRYSWRADALTLLRFAIVLCGGGVAENGTDRSEKQRTA